MRTQTWISCGSVRCAHSNRTSNWGQAGSFNQPARSLYVAQLALCVCILEFRLIMAPLIKQLFVPRCSVRVSGFGEDARCELQSGRGGGQVVMKNEHAMVFPVLRMYRCKVCVELKFSNE